MNICAREHFLCVHARAKKNDDKGLKSAKKYAILSKEKTKNKGISCKQPAKTKQPSFTFI